MHARRILTTLAATAFLALLLAPTAAAHASANSADGKVRVTWGLLEEPGYTHEKNRLDLILRDPATGAGIGNVSAADVKVKLVYGEEEYDLGNVTVNRGVKSGSFAGAGNYTSANHIYLTRPGIYTLVIEGTVNGSPIDLTIPAAHEYHTLSDIMFPDEIAIGGTATNTSALEARIAALEAKATTQSSTPVPVVSQTPAATSSAGNDAPAAGVLLAAVAAVGAALILRRR